MNEQPHTHRIEVKRRWYDGAGVIEVTYGDTTVSTARLWERLYISGRNHPSERRVRKAIAKAIRIHDEGSRLAGEEAAFLRRASEIDLPDGRWGSESLAGTKSETRP